MKKLIITAAIAAIAGAAIFGFLRPARTIETKKEIKVEVEDKKITDALRKQIAELKTAKEETEKRLAKEVEEKKAISTRKTTEEAYGPDGKIVAKKTTEETTDNSTTKTKTEAEEKAKKASSEARTEDLEAARKAEESRKTKEETTDKKQTDSGGLALHAGPNLDLSAVLAGLTIPVAGPIGLSANYIFNLPAPAIKASGFFICIEIRL